MDYSPPGSSVHGILQEWVLFYPPGDLPNPAIELGYPTTPALAGRFFTTSTTWAAPYNIYSHYKEYIDII